MSDQKCYHPTWHEHWKVRAGLEIEIPSKTKITCRNCEIEGVMYSTWDGPFDLKWGVKLEDEGS